MGEAAGECIFTITIRTEKYDISLPKPDQPQHKKRNLKRLDPIKSKETITEFCPTLPTRGRLKRMYRLQGKKQGNMAGGVNEGRSSHISPLRSFSQLPS